MKDSGCCRRAGWSMAGFESLKLKQWHIMIFFFFDVLIIEVVGRGSGCLLIAAAMFHNCY